MRILNCAWCAGLVLLGVAGPVAAEEAASHEFTFYVQQAWPQQTRANRQIQQINRTFGTDFDDWGDVANLSIGAQLWWSVAPAWEVGVQVDYGSGAIDGREQVPTEAGPAKLSFEQRYHIYADVYGVTKWCPTPKATAVRPFLYAGIGLAYESDTTTLKLRNDVIDSRLRVDNDGWFPTYTAGALVDVPFGAEKRWYAELGVGYVWARMTNKVPVEGDLAPSPTVVADTELTGPNWWLGLGRYF